MDWRLICNAFLKSKAIESEMNNNFICYVTGCFFFAFLKIPVSSQIYLKYHLNVFTIFY